MIINIYINTTMEHKPSLAGSKHNLLDYKLSLDNNKLYLGRR